MAAAKAPQATLGALAFALSGLLFVVFWAMATTLTSFVGAAATQRALWGPSQAVHCIAAIAGLLGTAGVHDLHAPKTG